MSERFTISRMHATRNLSFKNGCDTKNNNLEILIISGYRATPCLI